VCVPFCIACIAAVAFVGAKKKHMVLPKWQVRAMDYCACCVLVIVVLVALRRQATHHRTVLPLLRLWMR
jgi:hypothetical protein